MLTEEYISINFDVKNFIMHIILSNYLGKEWSNGNYWPIYFWAKYFKQKGKILLSFYS